MADKLSKLLLGLETAETLAVEDHLRYGRVLKPNEREPSPFYQTFPLSIIGKSGICSDCSHALWRNANNLPPSLRTRAKSLTFSGHMPLQ